jgi:hypothetical protein
MKLNYIILWGVCITLALHSCKKDNDDKKENTQTPTSSVVGTWKLVKTTATLNYGGMDTTMDLPNYDDSCEADNAIRLNANNTISQIGGAIKCDPSEPAAFDYGNWELLNNNTQFKMIYGGDTMVFDVLILNTTTFKLSTIMDSGGTPTTIRYTYSKQ